jgi:transposase
MLSKGIKEFSALWRYLKEHPEVRRSCGLEKLPDRSTLSRRMRNFPPVLENEIENLACYLIRLKLIDPTVVAIDRSLLKAKGAPWHKKDQKNRKSSYQTI